MEKEKLLGKKVLYRISPSKTGYGKVVDQLGGQCKVQIFKEGLEYTIARVHVLDIIKVY